MKQYGTRSTHRLMRRGAARRRQKVHPAVDGVGVHVAELARAAVSQVDRPVRRLGERRQLLLAAFRAPDENSALLTRRLAFSRVKAKSKQQVSVLVLLKRLVRRLGKLLLAASWRPR